jgi:hypothetical protein
VWQPLNKTAACLQHEQRSALHAGGVTKHAQRPASSLALLNVTQTTSTVRAPCRLTAAPCRRSRLTATTIAGRGSCCPPALHHQWHLPRTTPSKWVSRVGGFLKRAQPACVAGLGCSWAGALRVVLAPALTHKHPPSGSVHDPGVMLGAGSYARVYRAKWAGLDVAVKVGLRARGKGKG